MQPVKKTCHVLKSSRSSRLIRIVRNVSIHEVLGSSIHKVNSMKQTKVLGDLSIENSELKFLFTMFKHAHWLVSCLHRLNESGQGFLWAEPTLAGQVTGRSAWPQPRMNNLGVAGGRLNFARALAASCGWWHVQRGLTMWKVVRWRWRLRWIYSKA